MSEISTSHFTPQRFPDGTMSQPNEYTIVLEGNRHVSNYSGAFRRACYAWTLAGDETGERLQEAIEQAQSGEAKWAAESADQAIAALEREIEASKVAVAGFYAVWPKCPPERSELKIARQLLREYLIICTRLCARRTDQPFGHKTIGSTNGGRDIACQPDEAHAGEYWARFNIIEEN